MTFYDSDPFLTYIFVFRLTIQRSCDIPLKLWLKSLRCRTAGFGPVTSSWRPTESNAAISIIKNLFRWKIGVFSIHFFNKCLVHIKYLFQMFLLVFVISTSQYFYHNFSFYANVRKRWHSDFTVTLQGLRRPLHSQSITRTAAMPRSLSSSLTKLNSDITFRQLPTDPPQPHTPILHLRVFQPATISPNSSGPKPRRWFGHSRRAETPLKTVLED